LELVLQSDLLELPESSQHFARLVVQRALLEQLVQQIQRAQQEQLEQQVVNCCKKYLVELQVSVLVVFRSLAH
jgi:membrane carboxypeptidase/penicillin-binding protein PbpC